MATVNFLSRCILSALVAVPALTLAQVNDRYDWSISHESIGHNSLLISEGSQSVKLKSGWTYIVEKLSDGGLYQARTTKCQIDKEQFEFTVQCEQKRPQGHTQIRFRDSSTGKSNDYLEVSCEHIEK